METGIATGLISAASALILGLGVLILNDGLHNELNRRIDDLKENTNTRLDKIDGTLDLIQADLKVFYNELVRIKSKTGLD